MARLAPPTQSWFGDRRIVVVAATVPFAVLVAGLAAALGLEDSSRRILTAVLAAAFVAVALPWALRSRTPHPAEGSASPTAPVVGIHHTFACPFDLLDQTLYAGFVATVTVSSAVIDPAIDPQRRAPSVTGVLEPLLRDAVVAAGDRLEPVRDADPVVALETARSAAQTLLHERMLGPVSRLPGWLTANVTAVSVAFDATTQMRHDELVDRERKGESVGALRDDRRGEPDDALDLRANCREGLTPYLPERESRALLEALLSHASVESLSAVVDQLEDVERRHRAVLLQIVHDFVAMAFVDADDDFVEAFAEILTRSLSGRPCRSTELERDAASQPRRSPVATPVVNTQPPSPIEQPAPAERGVEQIVRAAAGGDAAAWEDLVARFDGLVWAVARGHRLSSADAADVVQRTWLKLVQHLGELKNPAAVGGWLATTARRECLRVLRASKQQIPCGDELPERPSDEPPLDADLLRHERDALMKSQAMRAMSSQNQALVRMLAADPPASYSEISAALGMPVGSIGPTRARCLQRLRVAWISQSRTAGGS